MSIRYLKLIDYCTDNDSPLSIAFTFPLLHNVCTALHKLNSWSQEIIWWPICLTKQVKTCFVKLISPQFGITNARYLLNECHCAARVAEERSWQGCLTAPFVCSHLRLPYHIFDVMQLLTNINVLLEQFKVT